ncbi:MAG: hypothetical protein HZA94_01505 [Candidatus Vogelbacteria bacterium]|nr:hypothetical protein [Candidatus Vogelbacteria bacterium]
MLGPKDLISSPEEDAEFLAELNRIEKDEQEKKKKFPYEPFNPEFELKEIRKLTKGQKNLMLEQQRMLVKAKLERYKSLLARQKEGVAQTIGLLRAQVESQQGATIDSLETILRDNASRYKFSMHTVGVFTYAINTFGKKHEAVEQHRKLYPDDKKFFEACFKVAPKGKVEVVMGPMTVLFRCFDIDDYTLAFNFSQTGGDSTKLDETMVERAKLSGGVALSGCAVEELSGAVVLENASSNKKTEERLVTKKTKVEENRRFVDFLINQDDLVIETKGVDSVNAEPPNIYRIKVVDRYYYDNQPKRIQIIDNGKVLRDLTILHGLKSPNLGFVESDNLSDRPVSEVYERLDVHEEDGDVGFFGVQLRSGFVRVENYMKTPLEITYRATESVEVIKDKQYSDQVKIHEEQHQFNKLFMPSEIHLWWPDIRRNVTTCIGPKRAEDVIRPLIERFVRFERKFMGIDTAARDEILAYYKEGRIPEAIAVTLSISKLYDYKSMEYYKKRVDEIVEKVTKVVKEEMSDLLWENESDGARLLNSSGLELDEDDIKESIGRVFGEDYLADLRKWTGVLTILEEKGYSRDEIISLLYQEPVYRWINLAKRMSVKS